MCSSQILNIFFINVFLNNYNFGLGNIPCTWNVGSNKLWSNLNLRCINVAYITEKLSHQVRQIAVEFFYVMLYNNAVLSRVIIITKTSIDSSSIGIFYSGSESNKSTLWPLFRVSDSITLQLSQSDTIGGGSFYTNDGDQQWGCTKNGVDSPVLSSPFVCSL